MPQKLETVLKNVEEIRNNANKELIKRYHNYLISRDTSTNYQKDNIKLIYMFAKFLGDSKNLSFYNVYETKLKTVSITMLLIVVVQELFMI